MTCHNCSSLCKKFGKFGPQRIQRYRCNQCKKTFSEQHEKAPRPQGPLGDMRISLDKAETCLKLMLGGMSIRSIQRITGMHQETILNLLVLAGEHCDKLTRKRIIVDAVKDVEADQIWAFVKIKRNTRLAKGITGPLVRNYFTYVAMERNTKRVIAWHVGDH